jgi:hypothetical protein
MPHSHNGCQSPRDYFTEQLLSILVCGALGFVAIQLYLNGQLKHIIAPIFFLPVLLGGVGALALVAVRAVTVWREAGALVPVDSPSCQQNHVHTAACNHLPGLPGNDTTAAPAEDHGHSHDMSWVFARMLILVFPVALFAMGIPNSGFSKEYQEKQLRGEKALNLDPKALELMAKDPKSKRVPISKDGTMERTVDGVTERLYEHESGLKIREVIPEGSGPAKYVVEPGEDTVMTFNELNDAAFDADKRRAYTGKTAIMEGRFKRLGDKEFTLYRMKMTCCGSDAVMLKVRILAPLAVNGFGDHDWVRIRGVVQFMKTPGSDRYTPVLQLPQITDVERADYKNEYEF